VVAWEPVKPHVAAAGHGERIGLCLKVLSVRAFSP
jgi:hypothetical protein